MKSKIMGYTKEILIFIVLLAIFANIVSFFRSSHISSDSLNINSVSLLGQKTYILSDEKPIMLYFWASWCPICKVQSPNIQTISKEYQVITVAVKSGYDKQIEEYIKKHILDFRVINDFDGSLADKFGISVFPTTLIYDKERDYFYGDVGYTSTLGLWLRMWWVE
ncbi:MAG: protein disulfide oxidoreductase [Sulfurimonas sp.]|uniref:protein disulfide oxidoreductase n=1 Tax=Sulfurimonas sp. TaxID=2022749 RepID=UPI002624E92F|nr:protein disulfide oxidoreductase [Sulfurimonas sp.]MDD2652804.1 protein disulfide oxidoreductase [Sulfurimonas sp.]MDD3452115.1 protein disulfide oxidoreductase [Sulfurimonas sp.]